MTTVNHREVAESLIGRARELAELIQSAGTAAQPEHLIPLNAVASVAVANALLAVEGRLAELVGLQGKIAAVYGVDEAAKP